jgi:hypothetical protein
MQRSSRSSSSDVAPGQIYAFRTSPWTKFAPPNTGRFAAIKILGANSDYVAVAVLDRVWEKPPTLPEAGKCGVLHEHRFMHTGRPAVFGTNAKWWNISELDEVSFLGVVALNESEQELGQRITGRNPAIGIPYSTIINATIAAEGEWRWKHDRVSLLREHEKEEEEAEAKRAATQKLYETRLRGLTWDQLLSETPFERWHPSPPFPSKAFTDAARKAIHDSCRQLRDLGPKPRKGEVRAVLKRCVEWFNQADRHAGHPIETEEREDVCAALAELAFVARHKELADEIDEWREW